MEKSASRSKASLSILIIEDDPLMQATFRMLVEGHRMQLFPDARSALRELADDARTRFDLAFLDLRNQGDPEGEHSMAAIPALRARLGNGELIIQSGVSDVQTMRRCIQLGASRFLTKDNLADEVRALVERYSEMQLMKRELDREILGESDVMLRLKRELLNLKYSNAVDVLVEGETGSGKELCARALHVDGPFVAVNVSAIPAELFESEFFGAEKGSYTGAVNAREGHFESAGAGTLFLDEIQSLSPQHQAKLLRVLETRRFTRVGTSKERPFSARVVCASNRNLREEVAKGRFREDLYYRIAQVMVQVPPLRARARDIAALAEAFRREFDPSDKVQFTPAGLSYLTEGHDWPGNVRELRGVVRKLVMSARMPLIDAPEVAALLKGSDLAGQELAALPGASAQGDAFSVDWGRNFDENIEALERHLLQKTLATLSTTEARDKLGLARSRFYEKVKQYGLLK